MITQVPLSRGLVATVDAKDYERVVAAGPWHANPRGQTVYAQRNVRRPEGGYTTQGLHNFLTGWTFVDHANGNGLDNRRSNLRQATRSQNAANVPRRRTGTSGFKGVHRNRAGGKPWRAQIRVGYQRRHLGVFNTPEAAARAYDEAARELFGDFAQTNFSKEQHS